MNLEPLPDPRGLLIDAIDALFEPELAALRTERDTAQQALDQWLDKPAYRRRGSVDHTRALADRRDRSGEVWQAARLRCWRLWKMPIQPGRH